MAPQTKILRWMRILLTLRALVAYCEPLPTLGNHVGCSISGGWHVFGTKEDQVYKVMESVHDSFIVERTSATGSKNIGSGTVTNLKMELLFYGLDKRASGTLSSDCATISWNDGSQWHRIAPDLCRQVLGPDVQINFSSGFMALGNGYTCVTVDLHHPRMSSLRADFTGGGDYGANVLASGGMVLERLDRDGTIQSSASAGPADARVIIKTNNLVKVQISNITDGQEAAAIDTWTFALRIGARSLEFTTTGSLSRTVSAKTIRYNFAFEPTSVYALFDRGVVQMLRGKASANHYASADGLSRLYALGGSGEDLKTAGNLSVSMRRQVNGSLGVVVFDCDTGGRQGYSGLQEILAGRMPEVDTWSAGWTKVEATLLHAGHEWTASYDLAPNNFDFPVQGPFGDLTTSGNIVDDQLQAMLTGIYGSPVGQLCTHDNGVAQGSRVGQMATTIARPDYGYAGTYNYFDPDNYISTAALLFSGDPYLQGQVRQVLERNGDFINANGQLPHHFKGITPTYQALSGEIQTGPNVFWILSCLNYAKTTGDLDWLRGYIPKLRNASAFLFDMIDSGFNLLNSPGSLMIDVFIRNNFTTDTNSMAVGFLHEFADAEEAVGNNTGAAHLRTIATAVAKATDALLFSNESGDHYVTQLNPDGTSRDFVDYDANLIALAHGVASTERASKIFQRIDSGRCVHGRATFVSERYYGQHDTTHGNIGDSWCSMGRIGWFDALARKRYGDQQTFDSLLLDPLIGDVNRWTWLHERYHCDGTPEQNRTSHYFEYPAVTAMMLHFVRYGIQLGLTTVTVSPFGPVAFKYHVGAMHLEYDSKSSHVQLSMPGKGTRLITIEHLEPNLAFVYKVGAAASTYPWPVQPCGVTESGKAIASTDGVLSFNGTVGDEIGPCIITVQAEAADFII